LKDAAERSSRLPPVIVIARSLYDSPEPARDGAENVGDELGAVVPEGVHGVEIGAADADWREPGGVVAGRRDDGEYAKAGVGQHGLRIAAVAQDSAWKAAAECLVDDAGDVRDVVAVLPPSSLQSLLRSRAFLPSRRL